MIISLAQRITWLAMLLLNCFLFRLRVSGKESTGRLKSGPLIIACNHKSFWDNFFLDYALGFNFPTLRFMTADWVFKKWWGFIAVILGGFPIFKKQGLEVSLKKPLKILRNKGVVVIYPEGKIIKESNLVGKPRRGVGALGLWSNATILPVAIKGSRGMRNKKKAEVKFGSPFLIRDLMSPASLNPTMEDFAEASEIIMDKIRDLFYK